jgi:hypothetical protein
MAVLNSSEMSSLCASNSRMIRSARSANHLEQYFHYGFFSMNNKTPPPAPQVTPPEVLSFFSSRWNWDSPNYSPARECAPGGGAHSLAREGMGEFQFRRGDTLWYSIFVCTLWVTCFYPAGIHSKKYEMSSSYASNSRIIRSARSANHLEQYFYGFLWSMRQPTPPPPVPQLTCFYPAGMHSKKYEALLLTHSQGGESVSAPPPPPPSVNLIFFGPQMTLA